MTLVGKREPARWRGNGQWKDHAELFVKRSPERQEAIERRQRRDDRARARRLADAEAWIKSLRIGRALKGKR